jgi:hypothetical protein
LLLSTIDPEGLSGQPAAALASAKIRKCAGQQVNEIVERIKAAGQRGKLKHWNARYKQYRLAQGAKGEKVIGYGPFLEQAVMLPTVRSIAAGAG